MRAWTMVVAAVLVTCGPGREKPTPDSVAAAVQTRVREAESAEAASGLDALLEPLETEDVAEQGVALWMAGLDWAAAYTFATVLSRDPSDWLAANNLGATLIRLGEHQLALDALAVADGLAPENGMVLANLGVASIRLGRRGEAKGYLQRALALHPGSPEANRAMAGLLSEEGAYGEAQAFFVAARAGGAWTDDVTGEMEPPDDESVQQSVAPHRGLIPWNAPDPGEAPLVSRPQIPAKYGTYVKTVDAYLATFNALMSEEQGYYEQSDAVGIGRIRNAGTTVERTLSESGPCTECMVSDERIRAALSEIHTHYNGRAHALWDDVQTKVDAWRADTVPWTFQQMDAYNAAYGACSNEGSPESVGICQRSVNNEYCAIFGGRGDQDLSNFKNAYEIYWNDLEALVEEWWAVSAPLVGSFRHPDDYQAMSLALQGDAMDFYVGGHSGVLALGAAIGDLTGLCDQDYTALDQAIERRLNPPTRNPCPPGHQLRIDFVVAEVSAGCESVGVKVGVGPVAQLGFSYNPSAGTGTLYVGVGKSISLPGDPGVGPKLGAEAGLSLTFDGTCRIVDAGFKAEIGGQLHAGVNPPAHSNGISAGAPF